MSNRGMSNPPDPITTLTESAAATHELFQSYLAAGFTEDQALRLVAGIIAAAATRRLIHHGRAREQRRAGMTTGTGGDQT